MPRNVFFLALFLAIPTPVLAAPFCVEQQGVAAECWYHDVQSCKQEAAKRNARCSANPDEVTVPEVSAPFCLIETGVAPVCAFQSGDTCDSEAARRDAVCFQIIKDSGQTSDPYKFDRRPLAYQ